MLSESNKVLLGLSQNLSKNTTEIDLKESKSENNNILDISENVNINSNAEEKKKKKNYNKKYDKFLDKKNGSYYYYTDSIDNEWKFTEINGTLNQYYFKCRTNKCKAFGTIDKNNENQVFTLTKAHNIKYISHIYYKKKFVLKNY